MDTTTIWIKAMLQTTIIKSVNSLILLYNFNFYG